MSRQTNAYDRHVGRRLRAARTLAGFSQERLGQAVQVSFQQIQKYEKGINRIGASRLQAFAQVLNVMPSFFFEDMEPQDGPDGGLPVDSEGASAVLEGAVSRRQALELVRYYGRIHDEEIREAFFQLAKACARLTEKDGMPAEGGSTPA